MKYTPKGEKKMGMMKEDERERWTSLEAENDNRPKGPREKQARFLSVWVT
jgi:hypothetical protein